MRSMKKQREVNRERPCMYGEGKKCAVINIGLMRFHAWDTQHN